MGKIKNTLSDIDPDIIICDDVKEVTKNGTTFKRISIKTKEHNRAYPHCNSEDCNIRQEAYREAHALVPCPRRHQLDPAQVSL